MQIVSSLIWTMPSEEFVSARGNTKQPAKPSLLKGNETQLNAIYQNDDISTRLFPNKVLLRDSEAFIVGPSYVSNVHQMLCHSEYINMFLDDQSHCTSLSFGAVMPTGSSMEICRYWIDYYGDAQFDLLLAHFLIHAQRLLEMLPNMPTCNLITFQFALSSCNYESSANSQFKDFFLQHSHFRLYFGGEKRIHAQLVCDYKLKKIMKHKL